MNTTLSDQIKAIQEAREILLGNGYTSLAGQNNNLDGRLNDAGSSLAALNLNPDREKRIKELENSLSGLVYLISSNDNENRLWLNDADWAIIESARSLANLKFDAAISGFASPDELTK